MNKIILFINFFFCFLIILLLSIGKFHIELNMDSHENISSDYEKIDLEKCFMTIHHLISIENNNELNSKASVQTFVYMATKPHLIQLLNNVSEDCLCCPNNSTIFKDLL